ncbi:MAG: hypothetical protein J0I06_01465 [Planctomycetes bacterium]|nr:hypothetical protein [Planctomycetota bacterium]
MSTDPQQKIEAQIRKAGLPIGGTHPFRPRLGTNSRGDPVIEKQAVTTGPKAGKRGYVDDQGRIWIRDRAHSTVPDHWDVQIDGGQDYFRVDNDGNLIQ